MKKYLKDCSTLVDKLPATRKICETSIILIRLDPRFTSSFVKVCTERASIICGEKINITVPIVIKKRNVEFIIDDAT